MSLSKCSPAEVMSFNNNKQHQVQRPAFSFHDIASLSTSASAPPSPPRTYAPPSPPSSYAPPSPPSTYAPPSPPGIPPLPDMSVFSHEHHVSKKRTHAEMEALAGCHSHHPHLQPTPPKLSLGGTGGSPFRGLTPPQSPFSTGAQQPPSPTHAHHDCGHDCRTGPDERALTNLDIAAFYWSMLAMRGHQELKAKTAGAGTPMYDSMAIPPPSPAASSNYEPTSPYSKPPSPYSKPPSPSGSLSSSYDSEPSSPSGSSTTSETPQMKELSGGGVKYQCHVCHKGYSHPRLLNRHMQSHTPYKKHHCPRCRKGFNDAFDLKRHIRTHTGIKPFHCSLCEKSFTQV